MDTNDLVGTLVGAFVGTVVGGVFLLLGLWIGRKRGGEVQDLLSLHRMMPTPAARVVPGMRVKIQGTVIPAAHAIRSPLTGRPGVACIVTAGVDAGDGTQSHLVAKESCDFWIDDGSGARVLVRPEGAAALLAREWLFDQLRVMHAVGITDIGRVSEAQRQWARERLGRDARFHYLEECLVQVGQPVAAVGCIESDGATPLLRAAGPGGLTLVTMTEEAARDVDGMRRTVGYGMAAMGGLTILLSLAWTVWKFVS